MKKPLIFILLFAALTACGPNNVNTPTFTQVPPTASPTPSETPPTAIPEKSYETRDASGKLIAIEDIYGNSIKATHEVKVASATAGDWTGVNERLGADFAINADGKIPDVDGITVDKENGKVAFSYDGQHTENYNIVNMKTQVIEGKTRIMIGSYWWNAEAKAWKAFYLNFPMSESPKDELGWVTEADISNGNQLRWDQRRLEDLAAKEGKTVEVYMKDLFAKAIRPIGYGAEVVNRPDVGGLVNEAALFFSSPNYDVGPRTMKSITKDQWPVRALGTSYLIGAKAVIFSLLFLNNDETTTSLSAIKDEVVWTEHRQDNTFTRMALAAGIEPDSSMAPETLFGNTNVPEAWFLWPIMYTFPDAESTGQFAKSEIKVLKNGDQARKDATTPDKILASASLYPWGVYPHLNP